MFAAVFFYLLIKETKGFSDSEKKNLYNPEYKGTTPTAPAEIEIPQSQKLAYQYGLIDTAKSP